MTPRGLQLNLERLELVDQANGDMTSGGCNAYACCGDYTLAYILGTDPNRVVIGEENDFTPIRMLCPKASQVASANFVSCGVGGTQLFYC